MLGETASVVVGLLGAVLAFAFAIVIARVGRGGGPDRVLVALLAIEGSGQAFFAIANFAESPSRWEETFVAAGLWALTVLGGLYLFFISALETPVVSWLRRAWTRRAVAVGLILVPTLALVTSLVFMTRPQYTPGGPNLALAPLALGTFAFIVICVYAFIAAVSTLRRAPPGPRRTQARAYVLAFAARDLFFFLGIGANFLSDVIVPGVGIGETKLLVFASTTAALATVLFVPLLAYGILRTQLFDLDLRLKVGIRRSTVVTIMLVVVLGAAKVAELYLSRAFGFVAGGVAAGAMLVLAPRLNRMGEKVANTAMPQVQATPVYVQFKKLEVYRAAVESAQETGGVGDRERMALDRLRAKLGLDPTDCAAVETEVAMAAPS